MGIVLFIYGLNMFFLSIILMFCYIPIVLILIYDREFRGNLAYKVMTILGIVDVLQLFVHFYCGLIVVLGVAHINYIVNKTVGAIFTGLWYAMLASMVLLTYNRFCVIVLSKYSIFSSSIVTNFLVFLCFLNFFIPTVLKLLPGCSYLFNSTTLHWVHPPEDDAISPILDIYGEHFLWSVVIFTIAAYCGVFAFMSIAHGRSAFRGKEWRITLQISLVVLYFLFAIFYWYYLASWIKMDPVLYNFLSSLVWIIMNGLNPFVYLVFNKRLRRSFVHFYRSLSPRGEQKKLGQIFAPRIGITAPSSSL